MDVLKNLVQIKAAPVLGTLNGLVVICALHEQKPAAAHVDTNSRDALRRSAEALPEQIVEKPGDVQEDYVDWVKRKVDVDASNINFSNFDLETRVHKFSRKCPASKALSTLTPLQAMSDLYNDIYRIYVRKLERQISSLTSKSKEATVLKKSCDALNIERDDSLPQLLARLRAIDITEERGPVQSGISKPLKAALELVLLLAFRVFQSGKGKWNDMSDLLMLAGSLWLMFLQSRATRRGLYLLSLIDRAPWESGWQALWRSPCLYWIFPFPLRKGRHGTLLYVGQTEDF